MLREFLRFRRVLREEQPRAEGRSLHPPRGIETRRELESDLLRADLPCVDARNLHERAQTDARCFRHAREAEPHELAVLPDERHDIRHRTERHKLEPLAIGATLDRLIERLAELIGDADTAEILVRVGAVRAVRIHYGECGRQLLARQMVIRDDDVELPRHRRDIVDRGDAAVDGDEQSRYRRDPLERRPMEAIPLRKPVGNVEIDRRAQRTQAAVEQRRRCHAIHIVVAVNRDVLAALYGPPDARDRALHIAHAQWLVELLPRLRLEEPARRLLRADLSVPQEPRQRVRDAETARERARLRRRIGERFPSFLHICTSNLNKAAICLRQTQAMTAIHS